MNFLAKDFIETAEKLRFAIVKNGLENDKILCFLRYIYFDNQWQKVNTLQANQWLSNYHPHYLSYSISTQAYLHAVPLPSITHYYSAKQRLIDLLNQDDLDSVSADSVQLIRLWQRYGIDIHAIGISGSLLLNCHNQFSDIDFVFAQRDSFHQARKIIKQAINQGELQALSINDWQQSFLRRQSSLSLNEYIWHEQRKYNKALINQRKFDLSLIQIDNDIPIAIAKQGLITFTAQISDDDLSFDYPSQWQLNHPEIQTLLCFTATYYGQAQRGEWVEICGQLEIINDHSQRIIVGSNREATGEYIKVIR
ncbi:MAG: hypothetical protein RL637_1526 [Pseudomonadota bacterium]|jgi:predicted nucleotidyltransferase